MSKIEYFCEGRVVTTFGLNKECTFASNELEEGYDHHCPICGDRLLTRKTKNNVWTDTNNLQEVNNNQ
jgi:hypothetical protein